MQETQPIGQLEHVVGFDKKVPIAHKLQREGLFKTYGTTHKVHPVLAAHVAQLIGQVAQGSNPKEN